MNNDKKPLSGACSRLEINMAIEDLNLKKEEKKGEIKEFRHKYGRKLTKKPEPERGQRCLWDFILKDVQLRSSVYLNSLRDLKRFQSKKQSKIAGNAMRKKMMKKQEAEKFKIKKLKEVARNLSKLVYKSFWQTTFKIHKFSLQQQNRLKQKHLQKKRLDHLLKQQLTLSNQLANVLNPILETSNEKNGQFENGYLKKRVRGGKKSRKKQEKRFNGIVIELKRNRKKYYQVKHVYIEKKKRNPKVEPIKYISCKEIDPQNIQPPILLRGTLRKYQFQGLKWLLSLHQKRLNGILADEMGLGKTIQTIALFAFLAGEMGIWGPHLIIVPTTLLVNWEMEFKRWCPGLKIFTYFGRLNERKEKRKGWSQLNKFHVCITSYKIATLESKVFRRRKWYFMVLDEAQQIKNSKSQTWQALSNFQTQHRLLLTGTPLQNNLIELWALLAFLIPSKFKSLSDFKDWFSEPLQKALSENKTINKEIISNLHNILRPILLRRLKKHVETQLPKKTEIIMKVPLSMRQKYLYDEFINHDVRRKTNNHFLNLMNLLMQLRKTCNHPDLIYPRQVKSPLVIQRLKYSFPNLFFLGDLGNQTLCFLDYSKTEVELSEQKKLLVSNDNITLLEKQNEETFEKNKNEFNSRIGALKLEFKNRMVRKAITISNQRVLFSILAFCHFLYRTVKVENWEQIVHNSIGYLFPSMEKKISTFVSKFEEFLFIYKKVNCESPKMYLNHNNPMNDIDAEFFDQKRFVLRPVLEQFYPFLRMSIIQFPKRKNLIYDSGKLNRLITMLRELRLKGHKCLIFTQMSKMLDLLELALSLYNFTYIRLDGGTKTEKRQPLVELFNNSPKIFCFISSTRSGGIGLNLTSADTVIFYDSDWNPAIDKQAQDRCHRIGQTRDVTIYRLISEHSIEENILLKNMQKSQLDMYVMEKGEFNQNSLKKQAFNMKEILGDVLGKNFSNISLKHYKKTLKKIEDKGDNRNSKQTLMDKRIKKEREEEKRLVKVDDAIDVDTLVNALPLIYRFGLSMISNFYIDKNMSLDIDNEIENSVDFEEVEEEEQSNFKILSPRPLDRNSALRVMRDEHQKCFNSFNYY